MSLEDFIMKARNRSSSGGLTKNETAQLNNDNAIETGSNASSTDDYVRELLDPDARPRNVWHLVEGPKISQPEDEKESPEGSASKPGSIEKQEEFSEVRGGDDDEVKDEKKEFDNDKNSDHRSKHSHGERRRSKTSRHHRRSRSKSVSPLRHHRRSRSKSITSSRHHNRRSRSRSRSRSITSSSRHRRRSRSRSITSSRHHRRTRSRSKQRSQSPVTKRDSRTILIMQLNPRVDSRDLEDFFSDIGQVREVRLIMDSKTRRHKGIAYIEFEDASSAAKAFSLNGQKFFGAPIVIQSAQMDRNRAVSGNWHSSTSQIINHPTSHPNSRTHLPPNCYRVYVGGLHVNLTEEMIRSVFEPFGPIVRLELMRDRVTAVSRGYAFITYANIEDGQNAVQALDGFELAGKSLRVSKSTDKSERHTTPSEEGRILT